MKRKLLALLLACLMLSSTLIMFSSCSSSDDEIKIWFGGSLLGLNESEEAEETWIINQLLNEYEELNNVTINATYFEDEEAMVQLIENNSKSGGEVPDIACFYSSEIVRDMADIIYPIKTHITDDEKNNILYWETVTDNGKSFDESTEILGIPVNGAEVTFMAYNKQVMSNLGIDMETETPNSFDELSVLCEKIASKGTTPIVAGDNGWNQLYVQLFAKRWLEYSGAESIIAMGKGDSAFSDDNNLIESLRMASNYYNSGFINKDYATNSDSTTLFLNGQGAMYVCSSLEINAFKEIMGDNFGAFLIPDYSGEGVVVPKLSFGGSNQCLSVLNASSNKEEAVKIIQWLSTKENNLRFIKKSGSFPNRADITLEEFNSTPDEITQMAFSMVEYAHCTPDYLVPLEVYSDFSRYSLSVIIGEMTPEQFVAKLDEIMNEK